VTPRPDITQCERTTCFGFAPTYNFVAYTLDADTILMCEHYSYCYLDDESMQIGEVSGQAFSFSSTGTHIAVWNEDHIDIYVLRAVSRLFIKPTDPMLRAVINLDDASDLLGQGVWSPDGTWFVFSDADGLWRLDLTQPEADRELLIPSDADGVPIVDGYSGGGRYIFIAQGDAPYIYDTRAATILPDAIISPNDVHYLEPAQELLLDGNRPRLFWRNNDFALAMPKTFNGDDYYLADGWIDLDYLPLNGESYLSAGNGNDFDYEPVSDSPLVQNDAHLITAILGTFPLEVAQFTVFRHLRLLVW
jgi:hypothetical protein